MQSYKDLPWSKSNYRQGEISGIVRPKSEIILLGEPFRPGTIKPEKDYAEFQRLGAKLGLPSPQVYVSIEARDANGNINSQFADRSRTFNRNYWNLLFGIFTRPQAGTATFGAGFLSVKDVASAVTSPNFDTNPNTSGQISPSFGAAPAAIGDATVGIVVGTGTGAESFEGVALGTKVAHGNGAGQLSYTAQNATSVSYNSGTKVWTATVTRILNNNSGGTIVIAEAGIYEKHGSSSTNCMIMRDLLGATVSVLNAGQLTVTYTFTLTFPA